MKFWIIYRVDLGAPFVYGITDNKNLKDTFYQQRKKNMFYIKEFSDSKKDYMSALKSYGNFVLNDRGLITKSKDTINGLTTAHIVITNEEEMKLYLSQDRLTIELGKYTKTYAKTFNDNLLKALYDLQYFYFRNQTDTMMLEPFFANVDMYERYEDWPFQSIDELGVFLFLYGNTLDTKNILKSG